MNSNVHDNNDLESTTRSGHTAVFMGRAVHQNFLFTRISLLTSSPSMTLTYLPFSIAPLAVSLLLTFSLFPPLLPFPAPGRCFSIWVLIIYQFFYLSLSPRSIAPTSDPLPLIFRKLAGMTLPCTLTLTVLLQRNTRLFLFSLLPLSLPLWH